MMIADDKHNWTNHFLSIAENNCNDNCISSINAQIIYFPVQKLIEITIDFHILYQCAIMSEISLNITIHCIP